MFYAQDHISELNAMICTETDDVTDAQIKLKLNALAKPYVAMEKQDVELKALLPKGRNKA